MDVLWDKVINRWYEFDAHVKEAAALEHITLSDVKVTDGFLGF